MKTKQKSVRVFEIISDDYDKVINFIEKKGILLKRFLLTIKTNNEKIKEYFNNKDYEVRFVKNDFDGSDEELKEDKEIKIIEKVVEKIVTKSSLSTKTEIFDKIIRSGFEINSENKLVFLNNINAGAKIYSNKEIEIFGDVFGSVICDGEYMIIKKSQKGTIIFHNAELPPINKLSFITKDGIKEL